MKRIIYLSILLLAATGMKAQQDSLQILWIGNSYTYYNNLPALVTQLAAEQGLKLAPTRCLKGGQRFSGHWESEQLQRALRKGGWDYIVMQEQSSDPAQRTRDVVSKTYRYAHLIDSMALAHSPRAKVIFYMTWGHKDGNMQKTDDYALDRTYADMQARLRTTYLELAYENHAWCSPVGLAWQEVRRKYPHIELYNKDKSHPSKASTYLAAHCFLATLLQRPYVSHILFDLPQEDARRLQLEAQTAVFGNAEILGLNR